MTMKPSPPKKPAAARNDKAKSSDRPEKPTTEPILTSNNPEFVHDPNKLVGRDQKFVHMIKEITKVRSQSVLHLLFS